MFRKLCIYSPLLTFAALASCRQQGAAETGEEEQDTPVEDTLAPEAREELEEEIEQAASTDRLDGSFDDFMFAFTRSRKLQARRTCRPLTLHTWDGGEERVDRFDATRELGFLDGDFYTVFYGDTSQIEREKERQDSLVTVDRIDLDSQRVRSFEFRRVGGKWRLAALEDGGLERAGLGDFLPFYTRFSADSLFQSESLARPLRVSIMDPEEEDAFVDGTIDSEQWPSFCSDVPRGVISNIRYGQAYGPRQMVMRKSGVANGMQELFTFRREGGAWRLVSYEN